MSMSVEFSPETPAFSGNYLKIFLQMAEEIGLEQAQILSQTDIDQDILFSPACFISFEQFEQLLKNLSSIPYSKNIGLEFGRKLQMSAHGLLGYLLMSGESIFDGLMVLKRFIKVRSQVVKIDFEVDEENIKIIYDTTCEVGDAHQFVIDSSISGTVCLLKSFLGIPKPVTQIGFSSSPSTNLSEYDEFYQTNIKYDADNNYCIIPLAYLTKKSFTSNESLHRIAKSQCEDAIEKMRCQNDFKEHIRALLIENPEYLPNQELMAQRLSITSRTMRRRLQKQNTTYQEILDSVRREMSVSYLKNSTWSIDEIAELLGYTELSNFTRAFKRWTGSTPAKFRTQLHARVPESVM